MSNNYFYFYPKSIFILFSHEGIFRVIEYLLNGYIHW